jgi:transglutaminase-like putative cysteine protease
MQPQRISHGFGISYQIPRNTLALLMIAQVVVVIPYALQLSPWIIAVGLFCGYWRSRVYQGRWDYPHRWIKAVLVAASVVGVAVSGAGAVSLEAAASLLILAFALKLIEMKSRRDAFLVIFLGYFVIATQFLFDQSLAVALYELLAVCVVTAAMVGLNQLHTRVRPWASLRVASTLVAQALPFTIVLFLFFPRIAPLWTVPLSSVGRTGISDVVKPGAIASLTQSDELAFRVVFEGEIPPLRDLYWRGLVYSKFADGAWSVGPQLPPISRQRMPEPASGGIPYEVLLEPTMSDWLFAMDTAFSSDPKVTVSQDYRLRSADPVLSVFRYPVISYPDYVMDPTLAPRLQTREMRIDELDNPRAVAFAKRLYAAGGGAEDLAGALLRHIRTQPYQYTLNPPRLNDQGSVDQFWFETRAGFCVHYASAFVYMMRAVGIPARMVGGYQGGEINPITNHLMVRQYDAHAWAEIWLPEVGWSRVDPTAAVAPERIERGLTAALSAADLARLSLFTSARFGDWNVVNDLLYWADSLEHRWNLWVVGYDSSFQSEFLMRMLGDTTRLRIGIVIFIGGALSVGFVALSLFWRRRSIKRHPVERLFRKFASKAEVHGFPRALRESPAAFVRRVAGETGVREPQVQRIVAQLNALLYNPTVTWGSAELNQLRRALRGLQFRLAFASAR